MRRGRLEPSSAQDAHLAQGNARQARKRVAADVLVRDRHDHVLLVDPSYKDFWDLPGGMAEANESPRRAAVREVNEELGLDLSVGRPLLIDWVRPHGPWDDQLLFIFDGGRLHPDSVEALRISDPEITRFRFVPAVQARTLLRPDMYDRLRRAQHALHSDRTSYVE
ncbi:NUDIX hydrolase [Saccharopolyspora gloriosae]|uniref:8-oxo-dGTP pyrophosphatase MutT (NUDIX family) n=1 Tax=Saccharopolyspora gloriosae TaxID=455344 RepID=A0A840N701_9PSEU|nr:NUDIX hydrolase [Saccharopolyspora gloriosae]MBB5067846.1 8-oxo-dGTP pyrophosphatase MutT (NUDIX family) [Saccharopolyspora gloriosae]